MESDLNSCDTDAKKNENEEVLAVVQTELLGNGAREHKCIIL
jgi:hypothetical protein